jgi:hypothetical protein
MGEMAEVLKTEQITAGELWERLKMSLAEFS